MKIVWNNIRCTFKDLSYGDVFQSGADAYIKVEDNMHEEPAVGVRLSDGKLYTFGNSCKVLRLDTKLVINHGMSAEVKE